MVPLIEEAERARGNGLHAVGWLAYEAAQGFDPALPGRPPPQGLPCARFSLYAEEHPGLPRRTAHRDFSIGPWKDSLDRDTFTRRVARIREAIAAGETYQINFTFPSHADFQGHPWDLFRSLRAGQTARHQAYLDEGDRVILSASPERFFFLRDGVILCRPMKGTAPPGEESSLRGSLKNRAENIMIVDMIRNDLGKIALAGTVNVPELFAIEPYPSLLQMTSSVRAETRASVREILCALFPCASITGAPKRQTMRWIQELEPEPRGVYTGAVGGLFADGVTEFNVAIRTAVLNRSTAKVRYDTGCGIVWDSDPLDEYRESRLKSRIIREPAKPFHLIETLRVTPEEGCTLWPYHRQRLLRSAGALGFAVLPDELEREFNLLLASVQAPARVRLLADMDGGLCWTQAGLPENRRGIRAALDTVHTPARHPELLHKTTRRSVYTSARERLPGFDDTLLINESGELMEFTIGNLVIETSGRLLTPALSCGLLPGTARQAMLDRGELHEAVLFPADLRAADRVYLLNALRGMIPVDIDLRNDP